MSEKCYTKPRGDSAVGQCEVHHQSIHACENATLRAELAEQKAFGRQLFEEKKRAMELLEAAESESTRLKAEKEQALAQVRAITEKVYTSEDLADALALAKPGRLLPLADDGTLAPQGVTVLVHSIITLAHYFTRLREREKGLVEALKRNDKALCEVREHLIQGREEFALERLARGIFDNYAALSTEPEGKEKP